MSRWEDSGIRVTINVDGNAITLGAVQIAVLRALCTAQSPVPAPALVKATGKPKRSVSGALESLGRLGLAYGAAVFPWAYNGSPKRMAIVAVPHGYRPTKLGHAWHTALVEVKR